MDEKKDIINYDFQGWPIYRLSLREIIEKICHHENGKYFIEDNSPLLDIYPVKLEDDGMGYGTNDMYVTDVDVNTDDCYINIWTESLLPNIELWQKSKIRPLLQSFTIKKDSPNYRDGKWFAVGIREKCEEIEYYIRSENSIAENDSVVERIWIKESDIDDE